MPQLGETVTEGTILRWLKKVGDEIAPDEPLFEVSTDKVDSEVPSPASGYLAEILVPEGATVDVGTKLAVVTDEAPSAAATAASASAATAPAPPPAPAPPASPAPAVSPAAPALAVSPGASALAVSPGAPVSPVSAAVPADGAAPGASAAWASTLPEAAEAEEPTLPAAAQEPKPATQAAGGSGQGEPSGKGLLLSPVVRHLVAEHGIDPSSVTGTGKGGRITREDVLAFIDRHALAGGTPAAGVPAARPVPTAAAAVAHTPVAGPRDEVVPFTNIRRLTAEHMVRSKATSAHTLVVIEADYEAVERVRNAHKDRFREEEGIGLTYLAFIARAVVETLRDYPQLNASVGDDALVIHRDVHLGIAVDLEQRGLIVPVVRNADGQSLRGLARAMADLAGRARARKLSADEVVGGTFTISNPGPFGTLLTAPIINQPQVAILSTDGIKRRPIVITAPDGTEAVGIHSVGLLALSFDHRAVDGAYASAFLHDLARAIESRDWEAEL
jgi:2-oxoglutarate dehydrogenase E2 component (dihydrolipoamide succinyltransferase)